MKIVVQINKEDLELVSKLNFAEIPGLVKRELGINLPYIPKDGEVEQLFRNLLMTGVIRRYSSCLAGEARKTLENIEIKIERKEQ